MSTFTEEMTDFLRPDVAIVGLEVSAIVTAEGVVGSGAEDYSTCECRDRRRWRRERRSLCNVEEEARLPTARSLPMCNKTITR